MTIQPEMVIIPNGRIILNDDRLKQRWETEIDSFLISPYLVTQDSYSHIMNESPSEFKGALLPVESVSWIDAVTFCNELSTYHNLDCCYNLDLEIVGFDKSKNGFRLPTEAEWEYACKAGSDNPRYGDLKAIAWYKPNSNQTTHPVGQKLPNNWGLYDMLGNVWEWCSDIYDETVYGSYRIIRGGGWNDEDRGVLATNRRRSHPTAFKIDDLGFRIARNL